VVFREAVLAGEGDEPHGGVAAAGGEEGGWLAEGPAAAVDEDDSRPGLVPGGLGRCEGVDGQLGVSDRLVNAGVVADLGGFGIGGGHGGSDG